MVAWCYWNKRAACSIIEKIHKVVFLNEREPKYDREQNNGNEYIGNVNPTKTYFFQIIPPCPKLLLSIVRARKKLRIYRLQQPRNWQILILWKTIKNPFGNLMLLPKEQLRKGSSLLTDVTGGHHNHKGAFETTVWSCRTDRGSVRFGGDLPDLRQEYQDEYSSECVLYCLRRMQCLSNQSGIL